MAEMEVSTNLTRSIVRCFLLDAWSNPFARLILLSVGRAAASSASGPSSFHRALWIGGVGNGCGSSPAQAVGPYHVEESPPKLAHSCMQIAC